MVGTGVVKPTKKLIEDLYLENSSLIRKKISNLGIKNANLIEDCVNETFTIAYNNLDPINNPEVIRFYLFNYWMVKAINKVLYEYLGYIPKLKEKDIEHFDDKINYLVDKGYTEYEAREYVISDESLKRGKIVEYIHPDDNNPNWIDYITSLSPELKAVDKLSIRNAFNVCLTNLSLRDNMATARRDYEIIMEYIDGENQNIISQKYDLTPARVNQIIKRDLLILMKCLCNHLELDRLWNLSCDELE